VLAEVRVDEVDDASPLIRIQLESRRRYFRSRNAIGRQQVKDEPDRQRVDVETASTRFGEHLATETLSVSGEDRIVDRSLADEFERQEMHSPGLIARSCQPRRPRHPKGIGCEVVLTLMP
jgi:hypothetical protein